MDRFRFTSVFIRHITINTKENSCRECMKTSLMINNRIEWLTYDFIEFVVGESLNISNQLEFLLLFWILFLSVYMSITRIRSYRIIMSDVTLKNIFKSKKIHRSTNRYDILFNAEILPEILQLTTVLFWLQVFFQYLSFHYFICSP